MNVFVCVMSFLVVVFCLRICVRCLFGVNGLFFLMFSCWSMVRWK